MSLAAHIEERRYLRVEWYLETPESRSSPRGLGECAIKTLHVERHDDKLVKVTFLDPPRGGEVYYVPRDVLKAMEAA